MSTEERLKKAKKALKLKWDRNCSLKKAWAEVNKPKKKKGEPSRKSSNTKPSTKPPSSKSSSKNPDSKKKEYTVKIINNKERKVYTGSSGGKYYKSKGKKVYITK